jgi:hypothetical protein
MRGETVLCLFLLVAAVDFFLAGVFFGEADFEVVLFDGVLCGAAPWDWAGTLAAGDGASPVSTDGWDWATAGWDWATAGWDWATAGWDWVTAGWDWVTAG